MATSVTTASATTTKARSLASSTKTVAQTPASSVTTPRAMSHGVSRNSAQPNTPAADVTPGQLHRNGHTSARQILTTPTSALVQPGPSRSSSKRLTPSPLSPSSQHNEPLMVSQRTHDDTSTTPRRFPGPAGILPPLGSRQVGWKCIYWWLMSGSGRISQGYCAEEASVTRLASSCGVEAARPCCPQ